MDGEAHERQGTLGLCQRGDACRASDLESEDFPYDTKYGAWIALYLGAL